MKADFNFVIGIAYIAFFVGAAYNSVGKSYEEGVFSWWLPLTVAAAMGAPFLCGLLAGRKQG